MIEAPQLLVLLPSVSVPRLDQVSANLFEFFKALQATIGKKLLIVWDPSAGPSLEAREKAYVEAEARANRD